MNIKLYKEEIPKKWLDDFNTFDFLWDAPMAPKEREFCPSCDCHENENYYFFSFDIPGIKKDDIKIEFKDHKLSVSGERRNEYKSQGKEACQSRERVYGKFQRTFTLPIPVKEENIEAQCKDGVLELLVPKTETSQARKIPVGEGKKEKLFSRLLNKH